MLTLVVGGRGTETTVLLWFARLFTPLSNGEGGGGGAVYLASFLLWWGVLHKYSFYCINIQNGSVFWYAAFYSLKALVSGCKTKGFRVRNQGFQNVKPRVLQMRGINFEKCKQRHRICLQIITIFTFIKLKSVLLSFCIFMQFWGCEDVKTISDKLQYWTITRQYRTIIRQYWTITRQHRTTTRQYWTTT